MAREECVEFLNRQGDVLRGILHYCDNGKDRRVTIITLNTGLNDMVGWHRLQLKLARYLADNGYNVLRFDNSGIGNSGGEIEEGPVNEIFARIETGHWSQDAASAIDFIENMLPGNRHVFVGFCGGALTAIHSAAWDKRVNGVVDIAGPVVLSNEEIADKKDPWSVQENVKNYKRKVLNLGSIRRFLTGKSNYRLIARSVHYYVKHKISGRYSSSSMVDVSPGEMKRLNHKIFHSFERYLKSGRPILLYYAGYDKASWEMKKYFLPRFQDTLHWKKGRCIFIEDEDANHIFSDTDSQKRLKESIHDWLRQF